MGLTLTLTDQEIPASPAFIEFLYATLKGLPYHTGEWFAQEEEGLSKSDQRFNDIQQMAKFVVGHKEGKPLVLRAYRYFKELLTGKMDALRSLEKYHFYFIVGIPRTGGTYLTKQLLRGAGIEYSHVQNALAHDGFPHLSAFGLKNQRNVHTNSLLQLAEYLVMAQVYFTERSTLRQQGKIVIPKKFTKLVYDYPIVRSLFGDNASYLITLRHPLAMTQSVLEKSGGIPKGGKFAIRSTIERWAQDEWVLGGSTPEEIANMDYVRVLLGYWLRYHCQMATSGLLGMPGTTLVPYGAESMTTQVKDLYKQLGVKQKPEAFKKAKPITFSAKHQKEAEKAIATVATLWKSLGYTFPTAEINKVL